MSENKDSWPALDICERWVNARETIKFIEEEYINVFGNDEARKSMLRKYHEWKAIEKKAWNDFIKLTGETITTHPDENKTWKELYEIERKKKTR